MKHLLLIDDSTDMGDMIAGIAAPLGYACEHATTFAGFTAVLAQNTDIIVVDLMMPDVDGIEVLRYLGAQQCRAGIILHSGAHLRVLSVAEELARSLGLRVLGRLPKPLARGALEAILSHELSVVSSEGIGKPTARTTTREDLRRALTEKQLVTHYQPQIDIKSGAPVGVEVLVRWQHPLHGLLFPDAFITQCESWNLIDSLTWAVVDVAFADAKAFAARGWNPTFSINVSALSLHDVKLPDLLIARARAAAITPSRIIIEITESGMIRRESAVLDTLARLRLHGFSLSIDDFGTGFSMMHQLKRVPADEIKIDKEFVQVMAHDQDARIIVSKTIEIGHDMGMKVVAEGVETQEQLQILTELDCDLVQGYLFARPMPMGDTLAWRDARPAARLTQMDSGYRKSAERNVRGQKARLPEFDAPSRGDHPAVQKSLLIIDDGPEIAALVAVIAKPLGYASEHATTFEQFKIALAKVPTVIVVDLMMPDVDGIEVLRYLGEQQCRAGILLLSHEAWSVLSVAEEMARSTGLNMIGMLRKPFTRGELEYLLRAGAGAITPVAPSRPAPPLMSEDELRRAIAENQFVLHYQPRVDVKTSTAVGVEVLVHWQHPLHGLLWPEAFVGLSESATLTYELTSWVVDQTFKDAQKFSAHGWNPMLSINVPVSFLKDIKLPDMLRARTEATGISPARIVIEITDSGSLENVTVMLDVFARLRLCGFNLSIDDFGAGFSMMHQLKRIPANEIKIDQAFIRAMDIDLDARIIVRKTIEIGQAMGMTVVAKGVQTQEQLRMLSEMHCELVQGRLFSRPMAAADIVAWRDRFESREISAAP
jgi:EAL domain-containing protein (putative c-di-GMP-specific phosphodiesterase class I)/DNA-binding NarL/FixJ family response regulator